MGLELRALVVGSGFEPLKAEPADLQYPIFYPNTVEKIKNSIDESVNR